jgi:hypothetical protein
LKNLAAQLGPSPSYQGWLLFNNRDYGFVFQGATNSAMIAWAPPGRVDELSFGQPVLVMNPADGTTVNATAYTLSNAPILVSALPSSLVAKARLNRDQPFPWGGNYSDARTVSVSMGSPNLEHGLHQLFADRNSTPASVDGIPARDCSKGASASFTIDPNFLSYTHAPIRISAVVRRISSTNNPGFNLKYESAGGRKGIGWNAVPGGDKWHTLTWTISDDEFVGNWGYHFSFDSDSTNYSRYYLQQVTVTKLAPEAK